jgi:hypothetical protein
MRTHRVVRRLLILTRPVARAGGILRPDRCPALLGGTGDPRVEFQCGGCASVLFVGESASQLRDVIVRCYQCRAYNDSET